MEGNGKAVQNLKRTLFCLVFLSDLAALLKLKCDVVVYIITSQNCDIVV